MNKKNDMSETVRGGFRRVAKLEDDPVDAAADCTEENDAKEVETSFKIEKGDLQAARK